MSVKNPGRFTPDLQEAKEDAKDAAWKDREKALVRRFTDARTFLLMRHYFFGKLAMRARYVFTDKIPTMATTADLTIYMNPDFSERLNVGELAFVLAHEICHHGYMHFHRAGNKNPQLWNAAGDYMMNPMLVEAGLPMPVLDDRWKDHPEFEQMKKQAEEKGHNFFGLYDKEYKDLSDVQIYEKLWEDMKENMKQGGCCPDCGQQSDPSQSGQQQGGQDGDSGDDQQQSQSGGGEGEEGDEQSQGGDGQDGDSGDGQQQSQSGGGEGEEGGEQSQGGQGQGQDGSSGDGQQQGQGGGGGGGEDGGDQSQDGQGQGQGQDGDDQDDQQKSQGGEGPADGEGQSQDGQGQEDGRTQGPDASQQGQQGQGGGHKDACPTCGQQKQQQDRGGWGTQAGDMDLGATRELEQNQDRDKGGKVLSPGQIRDMLIAAAQATKAHGRGTVPGGFERWIAELRDPQLPWNRILERWISSILVSGQSYRRPSRSSGGLVKAAKMRGLAGGVRPILPGPKPDLQPVIISVDVSGSRSEEDLRDDLSEAFAVLERFHNPTRVIVWDAAVQFDDYVRTVDEIDLKGGGGTATEPMFEAVEEDPGRYGNPAAMICFTDGMASYPDDEPPYPVMWVWTGKGEIPMEPPFGQVVTLEGGSGMLGYTPKGGEQKKPSRGLSR